MWLHGDAAAAVLLHSCDSALVAAWLRSGGSIDQSGLGRDEGGGSNSEHVRRCM
eukprot:CAMPEP_0204594940 /NCGR_PEP_ID=MMETSP0661-20131031/52376_1 /ASSEMBLY_ACC=CAM_ASM_000606 /TAXON_ID=109239 /ORGANISM="Alexandrium margalefi, Strain AMGDE01CS-322" /LENGTH=53 /DNA_ID=CAMNT_0051605399 /DNA_START=48 /DNA_END=206 /DNA_ORIENTATION=-